MKTKFRSLAAASFVACASLLFSAARAQSPGQSNLVAPKEMSENTAALGPGGEVREQRGLWLRNNAAPNVSDEFKDQEWVVNRVGHRDDCGGVLMSARVVLVPNDCARDASEQADAGRQVRFLRDGIEAGARPLLIGGAEWPFGVMLLDVANERKPASVPSYLLEEQLLGKRDFRSWIHPYGIVDSALARDDAGTKWLLMGRDRLPLSGVDRSLYRGLLDNGAGSEALAFATKRLNPYERAAKKWGTKEEQRQAVLNPGTFKWASFDRKGMIGSIYPYNNPVTKQIEFFRLVALNQSGRYGYFTTGRHDSRRDNRHWEYLGTELPSPASALASFKSWDVDRKDGKVGDVFARWNGDSGNVEYFQLVAVDGQGTYEEIPVNSTHSRHWTYLGTDLPMPQDE